MDTTEELNPSSLKTTTMLRDEAYEFTAPQWYDFLYGESKEDKQRSELWFQSSSSHAPSPSIPKIKPRRSFNVENIRSFSEERDDKSLKVKKSSMEKYSNPREKEEEGSNKNQNNNIITTDTQDHFSVVDDVIDEADNKENIPPFETKAYTPKPQMTEDGKNHQSARANRPVLMPKSQSQSSQAETTNNTSIKREAKVRNSAGIPNLVQENQAIKRQKLDGGKSTQILNPRPTTLPHKTKQGLVNTSFNLFPMVTKETQTENRQVFVREMTPYVTTLFQTQNQSRPLTLTRPKEPEFMISQRIRPSKLKSTTELEEEILAKMPKFKARPLNKKILAAPDLPSPKRRTPHPPEFQEFHLETMARASQHAGTSSVVSMEMSKTQRNDWRPHLTEPKSPLLQTMLRARPTTIKTSTEIELEELEKVPKFKAIPLNKKIFESKGEMGIFSSTKKHVTVPREFHFVTDERISQPNSVIDLLEKLSLNSDSCRGKPLPRNTSPNPFLLRTEERGAMKDSKFMTEVQRKQEEEESLRIPKATPYPYTTDFPMVPPKPEPKQCTKPEPFQLESLARHEEQTRKGLEERMRIEREEAQRRVFRAQPMIKEDPIPVPEKVRKPLTEIQEFNLHVNHRAVERAVFDHKIKEKEMMYKRYREETDAARMVDEERALKQLRRTMVPLPHARPVPNFSNPFLPQKSDKETTKAKSPKLRVIRRIKRRTMMASSSHRR